MDRILLSESTLNEFADQISKELVGQHYFQQGIIQGEELKNFSSHKQVNQFLLFQIYQSWNLLINKLNHPYFDFESPAVQRQVKLLQNELSRHIRISKEDFLPLLSNTVFNNLKLLLDTKGAFENFFFLNTDKLPIDDYEHYTPFFADFDFVVNSILHYHKKNGMQHVEKEIFFLKMDKALQLFHKKTGKSADQYRAELFRKLTGQSLESFLDSAETKEAELRKLKLQEQEEQEAKRKLQEEEARKQEEEKRKIEEEKARLEAMEKQKQESSFFDSLSASANLLDLDDEDEPVVENKSEPVVTDNEYVTPNPFLSPSDKKEINEPEIKTNEPERKPEPDPVIPDPKVTYEPQPEAKKEIPKTEEIEEGPDVDEKTSLLEKLTQNRPEPKTEEKKTTSLLDKILERNEQKSASEPEEKPVTESDAPVTTEPDKEEEQVTLLDQILNRAKEEEKAIEEKPVVVPEEKTEPENHRTFADTLKEESPQSLHNTLSESKVKKIKLDEIPIHKQYQFVQKVFSGNNVRFRIIVDKANATKSKDELENLLGKFILNNPDVNQTEPMVQEFIKLMRSRF